MPKLVTDYLKRSCFAPLSIEEPSSLSTVETSSSQRTGEMFKCSTKCSNLKNNNINEEKSTNENNESILVQCQPGPDCSFPLKQFGKKKRSLLVQELFLAPLLRRKALGFLYVLHKTKRRIESRA